jgi:hypothetical protein
VVFVTWCLRPADCKSSLKVDAWASFCNSMWKLKSPFSSRYTGVSEITSRRDENFWKKVEGVARFFSIDEVCR